MLYAMFVFPKQGPFLWTHFYNSSSVGFEFLDKAPLTQLVAIRVGAGWNVNVRVNKDIRVRVYRWDCSKQSSRLFVFRVVPNLKIAFVDTFQSAFDVYPIATGCIPGLISVLPSRVVQFPDEWIITDDWAVVPHQYNTPPVQTLITDAMGVYTASWYFKEQVYQDLLAHDNQRQQPTKSLEYWD